MIEAISILADDVWREAAVEFYARRAAAIRNGRRAPKGMQSELNRVIKQRFEDSGWLNASGRFAKERTWVRVTFRHQMSLGSDFLDAARLCAREDFEQAAIFAAGSEFLRLISPNDAAALVSFEKLRAAMIDLEGVLDIPLVIGELSPCSKPPLDIETELHRDRPRDITIPDADMENV
ncbi:MAG: hypothetical protein JRE40_04320 [Deltaproteobacteria bacterium]|nr:hypothetical protein [Deltaproteobacteria bacterium]